MKTVAIFPYELKFSDAVNALTSNSSLQGFLLCVEFVDFGVGYADCLPWPQRGDDNVDQQIQRLKKNNLSSLLEQSLAWARKDAEARSQKQSLLQSGPAPHTHLNIGLPPNSFSGNGIDAAKLKIKMGRNLSQETKWLIQKAKTWKSPNNTLDFSSVSKWWNSLDPKLQDMTEFIEDPCPFKPEHWKSLQHQGCPLALDHLPQAFDLNSFEDFDAFDVLIYKPARQKRQWALKAIHNNKDVVVTNSMDHPVGQSFAIYEASQLQTFYSKNVKDGGLWTRPLFQDNAFSKRLQLHHGQVFGDLQHGIGFGDLLKKLSWQRLI